VHETFCNRASRMAPCRGRRERVTPGKTAHDLVRHAHGQATSASATCN